VSERSCPANTLTSTTSTTSSSVLFAIALVNNSLYFLSPFFPHTPESHNMGFTDLISEAGLTRMPSPSPLATQSQIESNN
jgi:hypothetical protein